MRVTFTPTQSKQYGSNLSTIIRTISDSRIGNISLKDFERVFHGLSKSDQTKLFAEPLWSNVVQPNLPPFSTKQINSKLAHTPLAIIPDFKGGVDIMILLNSLEKEIEIEAIDLQKGGLAANTAEALIKLGYDSKFISLHGKGEVANFHEFLIRESGISPIELTDTGRDAYIHPCTVEGSDRKEEFWFVQNRETFPKSAIEKVTEILKAELKRSSNETLVLSAIPPAGANADYFAQISLIAHTNGKPVIFNPKQYDDVEEAATKLFRDGIVDILKPNVIEFTQFLKYARILYEDEREKAKELNQEIKEGYFGQTIAMAKRLMHEYTPCLKSIFVTFGENGLLAITPRNVVFIPAPKIKLDCSSGAGDSGIAAIIVQAKESGIDLKWTLSSSSLEELGSAFVAEASATAELPGNTIASKERFHALSQSIQPKVIQ